MNENNRQIQRYDSYLAVIGGVLIMLTLGVAYVWGIYVEPLREFFGWSKSDASLPFSFFLLMYTVGMIWGGRLQDKYGPTIICSIGSVIFSIGYLISAFTKTLPQMILTYGIMGGLGTGFAYVSAVATAIKWFPHKKGLIGGIVVFGFGAGAFMLSPIVRWIISNYQWQQSFLYMGIVFLVITLPASRFIKLPPQGWEKNFSVSTSQKASLAEFSPLEVLKNRLFYIAWIVWFFNLSVGLGTMGHIISYAMQNGIEKMSAAYILSIIAIFNGAGRIVIGAISDRFGRLRILSYASFLFAIVSFLMVYASKNLAGYYVLSAFFGIAFGSFLVLYPLVVSDMFGTKHLGVNYGLLFSSYGIAGLIGPFIFGKVFDITGSYLPAFYGSSILTLIAGFLSIFLRRLVISKYGKCII